MQFLSQARAMRSAHVNRRYCAVCAVFVGVLSNSFAIPMSAIAKLKMKMKMLPAGFGRGSLQYRHPVLRST